MSVRHDVHLLLARNEVVGSPEQRACTDRTFGLPSGLHATYYGLFLAYLGVMGLGFAHPEMILPMAIFVIFTVGFYVVPMMWAVMKPDNGSKAMTMDELLGRGIATYTGHSSGGAAIAQVLVLPVRSSLNNAVLELMLVPTVDPSPASGSTAEMETTVGCGFASITEICTGSDAAPVPWVLLALAVRT